jgi:magnesium-transporting ATPase (P-type)
MGVSQEGKASASIAALAKMMVVRAKVRRDGEIVEVPMAELVPGDVVTVEAGDLVPADGRILRAAALEIDESALTGESAPVPKGTDPVPADAALGDRIDLAFMNTQVTRGAGTILVTSTGMATEVGHISDMLSEQTAAVTPLTAQLNRLTNQILAIAGVSATARPSPRSSPRSRSRSRPSRPACRPWSRRSSRAARPLSRRPARSSSACAPWRRWAARRRSTPTRRARSRSTR